MVVGSPLKVGSEASDNPPPQPVRVFVNADKHLCQLVLVQHLCTRLCTLVCIVECIEKAGALRRYLGSAPLVFCKSVRVSMAEKYC